MCRRCWVNVLGLGSMKSEVASSLGARRSLVFLLVEARSVSRTGDPATAGYREWVLRQL